VCSVGTDGGMYHKYYDAAWSGNWEALGGIFISALTVVSVSACPTSIFLEDERS
jgi:hypothetical protein